jgi:two-component system chemotaxis response regulator CheB
LKTKILIVDDSRIFRSAVQEGLSRENDIEIIGSVWNGIKALEFLETNDPDIVTLDIEMPDMGGLETLEAIQKINAARPASKQIGVIMLSSHTKKGADITVKALQMGAYDFIPKPEGKDIRENLKILCSQLIVKIRSYVSTFIPVDKGKKPAAKPARPKAKTKREEISYTPVVKAILIGVSTGGPKALSEILPSLCEGIDVPIFIVQHMPPTFTESLAKSLNAKCRYTVVEARHDTPVRRRHVYIAPGGRHMILEKQRRETRIIINDMPPEKGCRPSVNKLFRSGAAIFRQHVIGVILTGMGTDGTEGGKKLKLYGAPILAQDEPSSVVWGMPGSAHSAGIVDITLPLQEIPGAIIKMMH